MLGLELVYGLGIGCMVSFRVMVSVRVPRQPESEPCAQMICLWCQYGTTVLSDADKACSRVRRPAEHPRASSQLPW